MYRYSLYFGGWKFFIPKQQNNTFHFRHSLLLINFDIFYILFICFFFFSHFYCKLLYCTQFFLLQVCWWSKAFCHHGDACHLLLLRANSAVCASQWLVRMWTQSSTGSDVFQVQTVLIQWVWGVVCVCGCVCACVCVCEHRAPQDLMCSKSRQSSFSECEGLCVCVGVCVRVCVCVNTEHHRIWCVLSPDSPHSLSMCESFSKYVWIIQWVCVNHSMNICESLSVYVWISHWVCVGASEFV